jgi:FO synthase subunit 1
VSQDEMRQTIRMAREILPMDVAVQVPPNLADIASLVPCGIDDLGGISPVTVDYINPEHQWPQVEEMQRILGNYRLEERLCIYPKYIENGWYSPRLKSLINRLHQMIQERSKIRAEG